VTIVIEPFYNPRQCRGNNSGVSQLQYEKQRFDKSLSRNKGLAYRSFFDVSLSVQRSVSEVLRWNIMLGQMK
jgi:hypothetical protein